MSKVSPSNVRSKAPVNPRDVWAEFDTRAHFFSKLTLAHDGGFTEVPALFTQDRFLWSSLTVIFLCMNLYTLFVPNISALATEDWTSSEAGDGSNRLLINGLIHAVFGLRLRPVIMMALLELSLLVVLILQLAICTCWIFRGSVEVRWHGVQLLLWHKIPNLMTFSSMRLLNFVTPSVFIPDLTNQITAAKMRHWSKYGCLVLQFLAVRAICALMGFEAFMIKFLDAARAVQSAEKTDWEAILQCVAFLNQVLGIVQINPLLQKRLFTFLFGGEDSFMSDRERIVEHTWCAMMTKTIWDQAKQRGGKTAPLWFLAVMLSYSHVDFQKLTLNEKAKTGPIQLVQHSQPSGDSASDKAAPHRKRNTALPDWMSEHSEQADNHVQPVTVRDLAEF